MSALGIERLDSTFKNWGYDIRDARIEFKDMWLTPAETDGDLIRIDPDTWEARGVGGLQGQGELLSHELTHSAQFRILGRAETLSRVLRERLTNLDPYKVPESLNELKLNSVNPVDSGYTLEALATRAETAWGMGSIK